MGFLGILEELFPHLKVVGMREGHDDRDENYRHAHAILEAYPDLVGIYNVGGSSDGIARALRERERTDVIFIGHGLTADTRALLIEGTMDVLINSSPDSILAAVQDLLKGEPVATGPRPAITMDVVFRENLPPPE